MRDNREKNFYFTQETEERWRLGGEKVFQTKSVQNRVEKGRQDEKIRRLRLPLQPSSWLSVRPDHDTKPRGEGKTSSWRTMRLTAKNYLVSEGMGNVSLIQR